MGWPSPTFPQMTALGQWLQVVDVTSANQGILMNRFSPEHLLFLTYSGRRGKLVLGQDLCG